MNDLLTLSEAAKILGVSYSSVRDCIYVKGTLQSIKIFGCRRVSIESLEQFRAQYPHGTKKRGST